MTAFVTSPASALALATIKQVTGSNQPVLGLDATSATSRSILGVPLYVTQYVGGEHTVGCGRFPGVAGSPRRRDGGS